MKMSIINASCLSLLVMACGIQNPTTSTNNQPTEITEVIQAQNATFPQEHLNMVPEQVIVRVEVDAQGNPIEGATPEMKSTTASLTSSSVASAFENGGVVKTDLGNTNLSELDNLTGTTARPGLFLRNRFSRGGFGNNCVGRALFVSQHCRTNFSRFSSSYRFHGQNGFPGCNSWSQYNGCNFHTSAFRPTFNFNRGGINNQYTLFSNNNFYGQSHGRRFAYHCYSRNNHFGASLQGGIGFNSQFGYGHQGGIGFNNPQIGFGHPTVGQGW